MQNIEIFETLFGNNRNLLIIQAIYNKQATCFHLSEAKICMRFGCENYFIILRST
jgi:hypothetical protein